MTANDRPGPVPPTPPAPRGRRILGMSVLTFWLLVALLIGMAMWATVCATTPGIEDVGKLFQ